MTKLEEDRAKGLVPPAADGEHIVEFVFRAAIGPGIDPDDIIQHAPEMLFEDMRSEGEDGKWYFDGEEGNYSVYIPEGSHWRDVSIDPATADLPGGNRLAPRVGSVWQHRATGVIDRVTAIIQIRGTNDRVIALSTVNYPPDGFFANWKECPND